MHVCQYEGSNPLQMKAIDGNMEYTYKQAKHTKNALNSDFPENTTPENADRCLNFEDLSYFLYWTYFNDSFC